MIFIRVLKEAFDVIWYVNTNSPARESEVVGKWEIISALWCQSILNHTYPIINW